MNVVRTTLYVFAFGVWLAMCVSCHHEAARQIEVGLGLRKR